MVFDSHVHIVGGRHDKAAFARDLRAAGVEGLILFGYPPPAFVGAFEPPETPDRLADLMAWARDEALRDLRLYPFYWIDPTEPDAPEQVARAAAAGVAGFKCICDHFYPGDDRAMAVWEAVARTGLPLKFHSGILYAGGPSSQYNRPVLFEPLFSIPGLRFCISHISWPWCDECLAVYGKWRSCRGFGASTAELYIDTTPGTPAIYRREALYKVYHIGYDIADNVMFGTDHRTDYNVRGALDKIARDRAIFQEFGLSRETQDKYFYQNMLRFVGAAEDRAETP